jgi:hypothetical protein
MSPTVVVPAQAIARVRYGISVSSSSLRGFSAQRFGTASSFPAASVTGRPLASLTRMAMSAPYICST